MPLAKTRQDTEQTQQLSWILHVKNFTLTLDKTICTRCQICTLACPKEAITVQKQPRMPQQKLVRPKINIDLNKCNFCGICDILCPYGAIKLAIDGKHQLSVVDKKSFPTLTRNIQVNPQKLTTEPPKTEDLCPLKLITITYTTPDGRTIQNPKTLQEPEKSRYQTDIKIDKDHCPCCTICERKLPDVIKIQKFLAGKIRIDQTKCPPDCTDCLDICSITGALYLNKEDNKIHTNEPYCVYCGACKTVCPVDEALELKRTSIKHTPIRSGAWNKALERLTSPTEMTKELKAKGSQRARDSVKRRMNIEVEQHA